MEEGCHLRIRVFKSKNEIMLMNIYLLPLYKKVVF